VSILKEAITKANSYQNVAEISSSLIRSADINLIINFLIQPLRLNAQNTGFFVVLHTLRFFQNGQGQIRGIKGQHFVLKFVAVCILRLRKEVMLTRNIQLGCGALKEY
jgi:hypothetical protein